MFNELPTGWNRAPEPVLEQAQASARKAVESEDAAKRLTAYYRGESNYAGATFSELNPNNPFTLGGSDLLAVHMLSVDIPQIAVRRLTEPCSTSAHLTRLLASEALAVDRNLQTAGLETLEAMSEFYVTVKGALHPVGAHTSNAKVTASKICARKRPDLFPIMDKRVLRLLGTWELRDYGTDWQVFGYLLDDDVLMANVRDIVDDAASRDGVSVGDPNCLLRHLDVILWSYMPP